MQISKGTGLSCSALNYSNAASQGKILTREVKKRNQKTNKHIQESEKDRKKMEKRETSVLAGSGTSHVSFSS
jgi:DNA-directed RNA polymerase subunit M/transcription elongation factor TFIIS